MQLSIVIPVYRSEAILPTLVQEIQGELDPNLDSFEVIFVNDCSPDKSWEVLTELSDRYPFVKAVDLSINVGQHNAIMAGLNQAQGEVIVMMDDDLQHHPKYILEFYRAIQAGADICYCKFAHNKHALWKVMGSRFNNLVSSFLLNKPKNLYLSSFKAITAFVKDEVIRYRGPYAYVDGLIWSASNRYKVIEITHHERLEGVGGYNLKRSISLWLKMSTSFSIAPLRLASAMGGIFAGFGVAYMIYALIQKIYYNLDAPGWTTLVILISVIGGVQLIMLGVIGEYLGRAYLKLNEKPQYVIRSILGKESQEQD